MRDAAGEFDDLLAAADLAKGIGEYLAVFGGEDSGQFALSCVEQFAEFEHDRGALVSEVSRHAGKAAAAASITARGSSTLPRATSPVTSPVAGLVTGDVLPLVPG